MHYSYVIRTWPFLCARKRSQWAFVMLACLICVSETMKCRALRAKPVPLSTNKEPHTVSVLKAALFLSNGLLYSVASINHSLLHNTRIPRGWNGMVVCLINWIKLHLFEQSCDLVAVLLNLTWSDVHVMIVLSVMDDQL